jgi:hypothetical protein
MLLSNFNWSFPWKNLLTFLVHIIQSIGCQFQGLTSEKFFDFSCKSISKPAVISILFFFMVSCDKEEPTLPVAGPFQLWAINRPICPGMEVQLYLYDQSTESDVDFSEFTFELLPNGLGEIRQNGLYRAPDVISGQSNVEIVVKWKPNPNVTASHTLNLNPHSESNLTSKIPHQVQFGNKFYGLSTSNEFLFGSPPIGTGPAKNLSFDVNVVDVNGQVKWGHYLGIGQTTFGIFFQDKILVSGWLDGNPHSISKIYDATGNDLNTEVQKQMAFSDHHVDQSGYLYLSNSSKLYNANPTEILKLSPEFDIMHNYTINYPVQSFLVNQDGSVIAFYSDESKEESGVVMVDLLGQEVWNNPFPYRYPNEGKLVQISDQKYGLVKADCKVIPCALELIYYEFGANGELINPGQTIASSIPLDMLINNPVDNQEKYYIGDNILDILAFEEEVLVVFRASTKNYRALMIKGTQGSSLEHWWEGYDLTGNSGSLGHIHLLKNNGGLEWKTFCGKAICTFQMDKNLAFDSCF